jgi:twinkle protein
LGGSKAGVWSDFATGESGDLLDLWQKSRGVGFKQALEDARQWLGYTKPAFVPVKREFPPAIEAKPPAIAEISDEVLLYLTSNRGLRLETIEAFKVGGADAVQFPTYSPDGRLVSVKSLGLERPNGKKQIRIEPAGAAKHLFGWQALPENARWVVLCEGEIDALTLSEWGFPALSVPFGAGNHQWLEADLEALARFEQIFVCFDGDEAGRKGAEALAPRLGLHRVRVCNLPDGQDPNSLLLAGWTADRFRSEVLERAPFQTPETLRRVTEYREAVHNRFYPDPGQPKPGFCLPFSGAREDFRIQPGELVVLGGYSGSGKSELAGQIVLEAIRNGLKACVFSGELPAPILLERLLKQATACRLPAPGFLDAALDWLDGGLKLFGATGNAKTEALLQNFDFAHRAFGVSLFVVDSLLKLGLAESDYDGQKATAEKLKDFAMERGVSVVLVTHLRKPENGNENKMPTLWDSRGAAAVTDLADSVLLHWRNRKKEDTDPTDNTKPDGILTVAKNRVTGWEGRIQLMFDRESRQYHERGDQPRRYVAYSTLKLVNG